MALIRRAIEDIYEGRAQRRYGLSAIHQLAHALQSATLAQRQGGTPAFVIAALLHDIGHMVHDLGEDPAATGVDDQHEAHGARWLAARLPASVSEPVRLHVQAKRYLVAREAGYGALLAKDSIRSLALQGGPMTDEEAERFIRMPYAEDAVRLRRLDEQAKDPHAATPPLSHFLDLLDEVRP